MPHCDTWHSSAEDGGGGARAAGRKPCRSAGEGADKRETMCVSMQGGKEGREQAGRAQGTCRKTDSEREKKYMSACREENATMDDRKVVQQRGWKKYREQKGWLRERRGYRELLLVGHQGFGRAANRASGEKWKEGREELKLVQRELREGQREARSFCAGREAGKRKEGHGRVKEVGGVQNRGRGGWLRGRQGREREVTEESGRWAAVQNSGRGGWLGGRQGREREVKEESGKLSGVGEEGGGH